MKEHEAYSEYDFHLTYPMMFDILHQGWIFYPKVHYIYNVIFGDRTNIELRQDLTMELDFLLNEVAPYSNYVHTCTSMVKIETMKMI